ncbi:hypothetical protein COY17_01990 [Candidatus Saccharibacteria bacterium CG_4_10_14_0_2_um_filter_52_9]|nr:MAG: hypothetical protein COY17_01990 [Candidatus Saccharibacteria bacterium CG_4_10_14_0_2_um_filter_52_9]
MPEQDPNSAANGEPIVTDPQSVGSKALEGAIQAAPGSIPQVERRHALDRPLDKFDPDNPPETLQD